MAAPARGLVSHYTFEEGPGDKVRDWSGSGNHGENVGAKYVKRPGGKGYWLAFDTSEAHVDCGSAPSLDLTEALTIELWFNPQTEIREGEPGIVGKDLESFTLNYSKRNCWGYVTPAAGTPRTDCRMPREINTWQHFAMTFDGKELKLYRDGVLENSTKALSKGIRSGTSPLCLRRPNLWGDRVEPTFKCMMADVRVYDRALSRNEIVADYQQKAEEMGKDVSALGKIRLTSHVYSLASALLVEADHSGLAPLPADASIALELRSAGRSILSKAFAVASGEEREYAHTPSVCPASAVSAEGKVQWELSTRDLPAGEYEIHAAAVDGRGNSIGTPTKTEIALFGEPAWLKANPSGRVLNNLVTELLAVASLPRDAEADQRIVMPRDGWIHLSCEADGKVLVSVDGREVMALDRGTPAEAMRFISEGGHAIKVRGEGRATLKRLVVRSIPEMVFDSIGYRPAPWVKCYGPHNWTFFENLGILDNVNVLVERSRLTENEVHTREWRQQGRKTVSASFNDWLSHKTDRFTQENVYGFVTGLAGFARSDRDGTLMSEFDGNGYPKGLDDYPLFAQVARKISANRDFAGKVWNCYGKFMYYDERSLGFMTALIDGGHKFAEEIYMQEQPTEKGARQYLDALVRQRMLRYQAAVPDCQEGMIAALAFFTIPGETVNVEPNANYKTFMDMQMNLLVNDPVFSELYGVMWYHSAFASDEAHRWAAKLLRHYCIEGRREMLSRDPYELRHIENADFRKGTTGWTLEPAEEGSIAAKMVRGFGRAQGRYPESWMGDYALVTERSAGRPNRFSQRIRNLEPGRLYSVKMFTADLDDITEGRNTKARHATSIRLDRVDTLPERSIRELFTRSGGSYAKEEKKGNRWLTYRVEFFRPRGKEAVLTVSDWGNDTEPSGPVGQQLIHNFIEIEPYLEY